MPIAHIYMKEGRSDEQKKDVIDNVCKALAESTQAPLETIRVIIQEVPSAHWGKPEAPKAL